MQEGLELWRILKAPFSFKRHCLQHEQVKHLSAMVHCMSDCPRHGHTGCRHVEVTHLPTNVCHIFGCYAWINKQAGFQRMLQLQHALNPPLHPPQTLSRTHAANEVSAWQLAVVRWGADSTLIPLHVHILDN